MLVKLYSLNMISSKPAITDKISPFKIILQNVNMKLYLIINTLLPVKYYKDKNILKPIKYIKT